MSSLGKFDLYIPVKISSATDALWHLKTKQTWFSLVASRQIKPKWSGFWIPCEKCRLFFIFSVLCTVLLLPVHNRKYHKMVCSEALICDLDWSASHRSDWFAATLFDCAPRCSTAVNTIILVIKNCFVRYEAGQPFWERPACFQSWLFLVEQHFPLN